MGADDISLEPLLNQSSTGDGSDRRLGVVLIDTVGVATHRTAIAVTSTAQEITITAGKTTIEIQNSGTKIVYIGGTGVASTTGILLFPNQSKLFSNVKDSFSIYVVCAAAETSTLRVVEYA